MMKIETTITGENLTHKILWECCIRNMETAKRRKKGSTYFFISAMLLAYLTYEAYINFLGDRFAPDTWAKEKDFFASRQDQGLEGKLKFLTKKIPITGIQKGQRPYQTIKKLKSLRDFLSHGKVDKYEKVIVHHRDNEPPLFGRYGKLGALVSPELAEIAVADIQQFVEFLHIQAKKQSDDAWFGDDPLGGIHAHSTGDSRIQKA